MSLPEPTRLAAGAKAGAEADTAAAALEAKLVQGIDQIPAVVWDACVGPEQPFLRR